MANWSDLKAAVASIVKTNGNKEITGQLLQNVLNNIISNVGLNSSFAGIATPETNPGTPDGNVFYLATTAGTYSNFNGIVINTGEAVILEWRGSWTKKSSGFATQENLSELGSKVNLLIIGDVLPNFNDKNHIFSFGDETVLTVGQKSIHLGHYWADNPEQYNNIEFGNTGSSVELIVFDTKSFEFSVLAWIDKIEENKVIICAIKLSDNNKILHITSPFLYTINGVYEPTLVKQESYEKIAGGSNIFRANLKGFFQRDLSFKENTSGTWDACVIDISEVVGNIKINASVRGDAYISLVDEKNTILWQTNEVLIDKVIDKSIVANAKYLYVANENTVLQTPSVVADKYFDVIKSIDREVEGIKNTINTLDVALSETLSGFYRADGIFTPQENYRFKANIANIKDLSVIDIYAAPRGDAYVSIFDEIGNVVWQTNNIANSKIRINLDEYRASKPHLLYLSTETSVCEESKVVSIGINDAIKSIHNQIISDKKYLHISIDDGVFWKNLIGSSYTSIFDCEILNILKTIHTQYDAVFTINCFNASDDGYFISDIPNSFAKEFVENKSWLKFAFHAESSISDYSSPQVEEITNSYNKFVDAILNASNDGDCIDRFSRLGFFNGSQENVIAIRDCNFGIVGLATADDERVSYYLTESQKNYLLKNPKLFDYLNQIMFIKSQTRVESIVNIEAFIDQFYASNANDRKYIEIFTHEYALSESSVVDKLNRICSWAKSNGYIMGYWQDILSL